MPSPTVEVEVPAGTGQAQILNVPAALLSGVTDDTVLHVSQVPIPDLHLLLLVFTDSGAGVPCEVEIPPGDSTTVLLFVPAAAGLPVADEDALEVLSGGLPGARLVLLKVTTP